MGNIGRSLEEINLIIGTKDGDLSDESEQNQCIEDLKTHANKLSTISIKGLNGCRLGNMSIASYTRIANSCPNVQVALRNENNFFAGISVLAKNLRELTLEYSTHENGIAVDDVKERLKESMKDCSGLKKLSISHYEKNEVIRPIFPIEMKHLQELDLGYIGNPAHLNHIASVTSKLKSIKFSCAYPIVTSAIEALACANPGLEFVEIFEATLWIA